MTEQEKKILYEGLDESVKVKLIEERGKASQKPRLFNGTDWIEFDSEFEHDEFIRKKHEGDIKPTETTIDNGNQEKTI